MKSTKSPSAPSRSLASCFSASMKLYEKYPNASFDRTQIATALEMSAASGSFKGFLSDLKQYGLIEKNADNEFVVAKALKDYSIADEAEKEAIQYELVTRPKLFLQIIENQGYHLPDNSTLANVLVARFGFNKERALKVARALQDSLEWANAIDAKGNIVRPSSRTTCENEMNASAEKGSGSKEAKQSLPSMAIKCEDAFPAPNPALEYAQIPETTLITEVPLGDNRKIRIEYPADTSEKEAEKACAVLKALAKES